MATLYRVSYNAHRYREIANDPKCSIDDDCVLRGGAPTAIRVQRANQSAVHKMMRSVNETRRHVKTSFVLLVTPDDVNDTIHSYKDHHRRADNDPYDTCNTLISAIRPPPFPIKRVESLAFAPKTSTRP